MTEPTKQETDQVFKVLKAQKANKVCWKLPLPHSNIEPKKIVMFRLQRQESDVVERNFRGIYLPGVLKYSQGYGRAHNLRSVRHNLFFTTSLTHSDDRSTNLDSWQLGQLRTMKVGGNASALDFFTKHGGSSLLSDSDTKKKYSSRIAELYREELLRRVKDDAARCVI
jgi:ADP-ribosylation factor GTPase-activating protein 2/3